MLDPSSITPGFLTATAADTLRDAVDMVGKHEQYLAVLPDFDRDEFPASITSYDSTAGAYAWEEQTFTTTGARETKSGGRTGTSTSSPAYSVGTATPSSYPFDVWLRRRVVYSGGVAYEFDYQASGSVIKMVRIVDPIVSIDSARPNVVQAYTQVWSGPLATDYTDDELIWLELI